MRVRWMQGFAVLVVLVLLLSFLAGCGTTPSAGLGVSLEIRVLEVTAYTARIQVIVANWSSSTFYPMRVRARGEECYLWSGTCVTEEISLSGEAGPLLPGETQSATDVIPISNGYMRLRWVEVSVEGRLGSSWIQVSSNRVYF